MRNDRPIDGLEESTATAQFTIALSALEQEFIASMAQRHGEDPVAVFSRWVREKISDALKDPSRLTVTARLDRLEAMFEHLSYRQASLEDHAATYLGNVALHRESHLDDAPRDSARGRALDTRPRLHEEIADVLREARTPLTRDDIAYRIRERGRYNPPRSGRPVSGATISARVSHPGYRHKFMRIGRRIALRTDDRRSVQMAAKTA